MSTSTAVDLDHIDLSDPDAFASGPPYALFRTLRDHAPVHWNPMDETDGFWSVTRFEDIVTVNKDWRTFSSALRSVNMRDGSIGPRDFERMMFLMMDPPEHDHHRKIVQKVFTMKAVQAREGSLRRLVTSLIDEFIEEGRCDLVDDLAVSVPLAVIGEMLGVPREDHEKLGGWVDELAGFDDVAATEDPERTMRLVTEMGMYVFGLVTDRRANPTDDLLSALILAEVDGEQLTDVEVVSTFAMLLAGGAETTRSTFLGGAKLLMEHPEQHARLIADPGLMTTAVNEIARAHTPFMHMARTATCDTEIAGQPIKAGEKVLMWLSSANRDERVLPDAATFDVGRRDVRHAAFGVGGRHHCLGVALARMELTVLFEEVLRRMPDMALAGDVVWGRSTFIHGFTSMPVTFTPGPREH